MSEPNKVMSIGRALLTAWGYWLEEKGSARGYGGGVDNAFDRIRRGNDSHSDPVLSELIATEMDLQAKAQKVDSILRTRPTLERAIANARYIPLLRLRWDQIGYIVQRTPENVSAINDQLCVVVARESAARDKAAGRDRRRKRNVSQAA